MGNKRWTGRKIKAVVQQSTAEKRLIILSDCDEPQVNNVILTLVSGLIGCPSSGLKLKVVAGKEATWS